MVDIDCAVGSAPCLTVDNDMGYEINEAEVIYWGRCSECLAPAGSPDSADTRGRDGMEPMDWAMD